MSRKSFLVDVDKCTRCQLCVIACKDEHVGNEYAPWAKPQPDTGQFWITTLAMERGQTPRVRTSYLPVLCQHCENAPCLKACPEGAIKRRDDGLVWIDPATCTGCGLCQQACPYDVIYMNDDLKIAQKCTGCAHRVDAGSLPRCVEVCPHDAILFGDETDQVFSEANGALDIYHPEYETKPRVYWKGLPQPWIAGTVIDADCDEVLSGVTVTVLDLVNDKVATATSDEFGDFWLRGMGKDRKYKVEIGKPGYEAVLAVVTTDRDRDMGTVKLKRTK